MVNHYKKCDAKNYVIISIHCIVYRYIANHAYVGYLVQSHLSYKKTVSNILQNCASIYAAFNELQYTLCFMIIIMNDHTSVNRWHKNMSKYLQMVI